MTDNDMPRSASLPSEAPAKANVRAVRIAIEQAALIPPLMPPPPPISTSQERTADAWENVRKSPLFATARFRHLRPGCLDRVPIRLFGVDADSGRLLYSDAEGIRRALLPDDHDRAGITSLFAGAEGWLCRLWPVSGGGWSDEVASETLFFFQSGVGTVDSRRLGFIVDMPPLVRR